MASSVIGRLFAELRLDASKFQQDIRSATSKLSNVGSTLQGIGSRLTAGLTLPIAGAGAAALKMATDFNKGMANISTLLPDATSRINELKASVQEVAVATGKSTTDISEGLFQVISAFGDSSETAKLLDINARAAAAGLASVTDAVNLTSSVVKGYGDTSAEAVQKVSDLAFETNRLGQTTFPELAASIGRVVPLASALNVTQEELFGSMATFTGVTGNAAEVSTQLRGVFQALLAPTGDMAALFERLKIESGAALVEQVGLQGAIALLVSEAERTGQPLQKFISSIEGQTLALSAAGPQAEAYQQKVMSMTEAAGAADTAFKAQSDGINKAGFQMSQLSSAASVAAQQLGDALLPVLDSIVEVSKPIIQGIRSMAQRFAALPEPIRKTILLVVGIAGALGPLLTVAGFVAKGIAALGPIFAGLGNPIGLAVLAIAGLVTAGIALWNNSETVRDTVKRAWESLSSAGKNIFESLKRFIEGITRNIEQIWDAHGDKVMFVLGTVWDLIKNLFSGALTILESILKGGLGVLEGLFTSFTGLITGDWKTFTSGLKTIWDSIWNAIKGIFTGVSNTIVNSVKDFGNRVVGAFKDMFNEIVGNSIVPDLLNAIKNQFGMLSTNMVLPSETATGQVTDAFGLMKNDIGGALTDILFNFDDFGKNLKNKLINIGKSIVSSFLNQLVNPLVEAASGLLGNLLNSITGGALGGLFGGVGGAAGGGIGGAAGGAGAGIGLGGLFGKLGAGLGKIGGAIAGGAKAALGFLASNPFTAIIAGGVGVGLLFKKLFGKGGPTGKGSKEIARDFGGIDVSSKQLKEFLRTIGLTEKQFEPIRKSVTSSPIFLTLAAQVAQSQGKLDSFLNSLRSVDTAWGSFNFADAMIEFLETADPTALNEAYKEAFGSSGLPKFLANWEEQLLLAVDATEEIAGAADELANSVGNQGAVASRAAESNRDYANSLRGQAELVISVDGVTQKFSESIGETGEGLSRTADRSGRAASGIRDVGRAARQTAVDLEALRAANERLNADRSTPGGLTPDAPALPAGARGNTVSTPFGTFVIGDRSNVFDAMDAQGNLLNGFQNNITPNQGPPVLNVGVTVTGPGGEEITLTPANFMSWFINTLRNNRGNASVDVNKALEEGAS